MTPARAAYLAIVSGTAFLLSTASVFGQPTTYGEAMRWYEKQANAGSAKAQYLLGLLYERGAGPRGKDPERAFQWFEKAAAQGHADAQFKVGAAYQFGNGVAVDPQKALEWYRKAAEQRVPEAQFNLAYMIENAIAGQLPIEEAARNYRAAADQGFGRAQLNIGYLYYEGKGVGRDVAEAWAWFSAAESRNVPEAADARARVEGEMSPDEMARAQNLAKDRISR